MDIAKILAELSAATRNGEDAAPLLETDHYVPDDSDALELDRSAVRRMLAGFFYWLGTTERAAQEIAEVRHAGISAIAAGQVEPMATIVEKSLEDKVLLTDIRESERTFAAAYVSPMQGGQFCNDYFELFVESRGGRTLRDAHPSSEDYAHLARWIESRAERFLRGEPGWNTALPPTSSMVPALWRGGSRLEWLQRMATYHDLLDSPGGTYRPRLEEYWSLVDGAAAIADLEITNMLVGTYFWISDTSIQEAVYRALCSIDPTLVAKAVLANIVELEKATTSSETLVDAFRDDLSDAELEQLADLVEAAPIERNAAFRRALTHSARTGSVHAARLQKILDHRSPPQRT